jgi:hypothetical protein
MESSDNSLLEALNLASRPISDYDAEHGQSKPDILPDYSGYGWSNVPHLDPDGGVIQMEFPSLPIYPKGRNKERARRKSYKNNIGAIKPDTLMLDRQLSASGEDEFCDGLFITDKLDYWTNSIDKLLQDEGLCKESKPVLGGFITTWKMNNETIYVIHTYSSKTKS